MIPRPTTTPTPKPPPHLVGVGMGPGDPALVTLKAVDLLSRADVVLVPETEESTGGPGRAETIVTTVCPSALPAIRRVPFSMSDRSGVSTRRRQAWLASAQTALDAFDEGAELVIQATIGDPAVYSTFSYLAAHVRQHRPEVVVTMVPGITAMQALACASRTPLVEGTETLALVPVTAGLDTLSNLLDSVDTVVAYKGGRRMPEVVELLRQKNRRAVLGVHLGLEDEQVIDLASAPPDQALPYLSTVVATATRQGTGGRL